MSLDATQELSLSESIPDGYIARHNTRCLSGYFADEDTQNSFPTEKVLTPLDGPQRKRRRAISDETGTDLEEFKKKLEMLDAAKLRNIITECLNVVPESKCFILASVRDCDDDPKS
eukprot:TRINITY_DN12901_c0_g1_i3.p1 TRINITY_DN12901_c0_g1~~TRINITY_DN12901_c0_g1_i3.p1  ORF type:complete len:116 (-),score=21.60 TRINITY_DN12901_c0_g1_i3:160-507(-)